MNVTDEIQRLLMPLRARRIKLMDESHHHVGHAGSANGGHFHLTIVSDAFAGKTRLNRQRMVNDTLKNLFHTHIHALSICAKTPAEDAATFS